MENNILRALSVNPCIFMLWLSYFRKVQRCVIYLFYYCHYFLPASEKFFGKDHEGISLEEF